MSAFMRIICIVFIICLIGICFALMLDHSDKLEIGYDKPITITEGGLNEHSFVISDLEHGCQLDLSKRACFQMFASGSATASGGGNWMLWEDNNQTYIVNTISGVRCPLF